MELGWASITSAQTLRLQLRFWVNRKIFLGALQPPTPAGVGVVDRAHLFLHKGHLGEPAGTSFLTLLSSASFSASQASYLWRMGTRWAPQPGSGLHWLCGSWSTSGHEASAVLSLPSHLFAGLFLGAEATEKKLKIGDGQQTWRKAGHLWAGFRHSPHVPGWEARWLCKAQFSGPGGSGPGHR